MIASRRWSWAFRPWWVHLAIHGPAIPFRPRVLYWLRRFLYGAPITIIGIKGVFLSWCSLSSVAFGLRTRSQEGWAVDFGQFSLVRKIR